MRLLLWLCTLLFGGKIIESVPPPGGGIVAMLVLFLLVYIPVKAIQRWRLNNPGEPIIEAGGLTEYDTEFARQVGEAAETARRRNERQDNHE